MCDDLSDGRVESVMRPDATPPWLVTAYIAGPSLHQAVAQHGPMPADSVFALMAGVAEALGAIHAAGLVHRDLKPSNVILAPDGPRVIDFGFARAVDASALTREGMRVGSPQFMAPEQIQGRPPAPAVDVFRSATWPPSRCSDTRRSTAATRPRSSLKFCISLLTSPAVRSRCAG